jgi:hypothetical protein
MWQLKADAGAERQEMTSSVTSIINPHDNSIILIRNFFPPTQLPRKLQENATTPFVYDTLGTGDG